jgi:MFS superfamily sulfate permease-like transporter
MERFAAVADPDAPPSELDGVSFLRLTGPLFFANADSLRDRIEPAADTSHWILLDFESVTDIDPTASEALADSVALVQTTGKVIGIARASTAVRSLLERYSLTEAVGSKRFYATNRSALAAYLEETGRGTPRRLPADELGRVSRCAVSLRGSPPQ